MVHLDPDQIIWYDLQIVLHDWLAPPSPWINRLERRSFDPDQNSRGLFAAFRITKVVW